MKYGNFKFCLLLLAGLWAPRVQGQVNIFGKPGVISTPTAEWNEEKPLSLSFAYMPEEYSHQILEEAAVAGQSFRFFNARINLTSFMDIGLTIGYRPEIAERMGIGDRQMDVRFRLLKETASRPSIVLGWTPPGSASPILAHDYLVLTKSFDTRAGDLTVSAGYGSPYVFWKNPDHDNIWDYFNIEKKRSADVPNRYLSGFFGSLKYSPVSFGGLSLEYNSETLNAGAYVNYKDWFYLQGYTFEGREWGFSFSAHIPLDLPPRSIRRHEKSSK